MTRIILDGVTTELVPPDLDGDGKVGGVERIQHAPHTTGITPVKETSELGDALTHLNDDSVDARLSSIDFRTRIEPLELPPMVALDTLIGMGIVPIRCGLLNRVKMRKSVSISGKGRAEFVEIVAGKQEKDAKAGLGSRMASFVGMGGKSE